MPTIVYIFFPFRIEREREKRIEQKISTRIRRTAKCHSLVIKYGLNLHFCMPECIKKDYDVTLYSGTFNIFMYMFTAFECVCVCIQFHSMEQSAFINTKPTDRPKQKFHLLIFNWAINLP